MKTLAGTGGAAGDTERMLGCGAAGAPRAARTELDCCGEPAVLLHPTAVSERNRCTDPHRQENAMPLLTEGSPAPAFSVPNQDGTTTSLDQFAGKWLVLWWYPKADTPG